MGASEGVRLGPVGNIRPGHGLGRTDRDYCLRIRSPLHYRHSGRSRDTIKWMTYESSTNAVSGATGDTFRIEINGHADAIEIPSNDMYRRFEPGRREFTFTLHSHDIAVFKLRGDSVEIAGADGIRAVDSLVERANAESGLRDALQNLADEYDRLADRAKAADVAVLEVPYVAARSALGQTIDGNPL